MWQLLDRTSKYTKAFESPPYCFLSRRAFFLEQDKTCCTPPAFNNGGNYSTLPIQVCEYSVI
jgi:hypothetical protein